MSDFVLYSIVGSVVLTLLVNLLPVLFPGLARSARRRLEESVNNARADAQRGEQPRVRVFFPWKTMLAISLLLTILVNAVGYFAGR